MLHELQIDNFAVVDRLKVNFRKGLNLLTGETGSGKSIVVGALSLLMGGRGGADVVREGAERARICGVFEPQPTVELIDLLDQAGFELEDGELIVERQVAASGKSRCYINGRPATQTFLRELALHLCDIHGQFDQQKLFSAAEQMALLDQFAGLDEAVRAVGAFYTVWRDLRKKLDSLRGDEQERLRQLDLYRYQHQEIEGARLDPDEEDRLRADRKKLQNLTRLREDASTAYNALYESAESVAAQLKTAIKAVESLAAVDPTFSALPKALTDAQATVQDAGFELQSYLDALEDEPGRLETIEDRLADIEKLKRKYGPTLADVIAYGAEVAAKVEELSSSEKTAEQVEKRLAQAGSDYLAAATKLSSARRKAADGLETQVETELNQLAMPKARFAVAQEPSQDASGWTSAGIDRIRYDFSANPGQQLKPLAQVASGGELSRVTLAIKTCLKPETGAHMPRTLVFDEIDTGVGGRVAEAIGRRLRRLAASDQVLCVTHLPQIAGFADAHYVVEKTAHKGATFATVVELADKQRVTELARMLSGEEVTPAALANARQLLKSTAKA
ncbi:MAG: DNA repair protein RecN [Acidobacteria bacterium]|nr:DNA repair protein RecN [Acidobacteriota bacterium]MDA1234652.1 DNA repair protein RecN [Acidobacteriota bacterium]